MTPDEFTIEEHYLDVGDGHELYVHDWGNPHAKTPILFLHGGPGSGCRDKHKQNFDPHTQRVIFHDQRGCGRSTPYASLEHNTTQDLISDIQKIKSLLKIKRCIISGGSWGSCLALAYALAHPTDVQALVLRGIFTGSQGEIDWLAKGGFASFYPEVWQRYQDATPSKHRANPSAYHMPRALDRSHPEAAKASAYAYENVEHALGALDDRYQIPSYDDYDPTGISIEIHYLLNRCFMPDRYVLDNAPKLTMPTWLVQGRYDFVCPPRTAHELSQNIPHCQLIYTVTNHREEHESWNLIRTILKQLTDTI